MLYRVLAPIYGKGVLRAFVIAMTVTGLAAAAIIGSFRVGAQKTGWLEDSEVATNYVRPGPGNLPDAKALLAAQPAILDDGRLKLSLGRYTRWPFARDTKLDNWFAGKCPSTRGGVLRHGHRPGRRFGK